MLYSNACADDDVLTVCCSPGCVHPRAAGLPAQARHRHILQVREGKGRGGEGRGGRGGEPTRLALTNGKYYVNAVTLMLAITVTDMHHSLCDVAYAIPTDTALPLPLALPRAEIGSAT
jgi:hypothetical protein